MVLDFGGTANSGEMSPEDFAVFRDFINENTGIRIRDNRVDYLEYRIKERMLVNNISNFKEYYYKIKYDHYGTDSEFQELVNLITVHETSFFRHADQLESLRNIVLKKIIDSKKETRTLNLWSAVCSTGEEPLTLAMIIKEYFPELDDWSLSITATDISTRALDIAKKGIYNENSFRMPLDGFKEKYFKKNDGLYHANDNIKAMISYKNANLNDVSSLNVFKGVDVILCRNVFIYFPDDVKDKIARKFYELLNSGGALVLGNAEVIDIRKIPFKMEFHRGGPVYFKA